MTVLPACDGDTPEWPRSASPRTPPPHPSTASRGLSDFLRLPTPQGSSRWEGPESSSSGALGKVWGGGACLSSSCGGLQPREMQARRGCLGELALRAPRGRRRK